MKIARLSQFVIGSLFVLNIGATYYTEVRDQVFSKYCFDCHADPGGGLPDFTSYQSTMAAGVVVVGEPAQSKLFLLTESGEMPLGGDPLTSNELNLIKSWILDGALPSAPSNFSIDSVSPSKGEALGGELVNITGIGFSKSLKIFFGTTACDDLQVLSETVARCKAPKQKPGSVDILLEQGSQTAALKSGYEYLIPLGPNYKSLFERIFKPRCVKCHNSETANKGVNFETHQSTLKSGKAIVPFDRKKSRAYRETEDGDMPRQGQKLNGLELQALGKWIDQGAQNN